MSVFPRLKTGALAQYPVTREFHYSTVAKRFLDTSEQRYRDLSSIKKRWRINLSGLNETELAQLTNFFAEQQGRLGTFDFEDPWTGTVISGCRFDHDRLPVRADGELDMSTQLTIVETLT